jgi:hypothetical protein
MIHPHRPRLVKWHWHWHVHKHTLNNENFGLANEETIDTVMEMDMAHTYSTIVNARRNVQ